MAVIAKEKQPVCGWGRASGPHKGCGAADWRPPSFLREGLCPVRKAVEATVLKDKL